MAALYADENFSHRVVDVLRSLGHDVLTARDAGRANQGIPDDVVLTDAIQRGRVLLTFNRYDFIKLHRDAPGHLGIIAITNDDDTTALGARIHVAIERNEPLAAKLVRVVKPA